jgi:peptidoglycan/xylan/chitin deacetylase (PgdA/CDA1 family)
MSKKELLASFVYHTGALRAAGWFLKNQLVIINYHRIREESPAAPTLFDDGVFGPTQSQFDRQVKWLRQNFDVLSESELLEALRLPTFGHRYAAITFDDGYRDNYTLAYPVLRARSVPAIFFVCPEIIDSRRLGWWDVIAYLVKASTRSSITVSGEPIRLAGNKAAAIRQLHQWMKLRKASETERLLPELSEACGVPLPDAGLRDEEVMTWPELVDVSRNGVAVGSHTHTHRVLATVDEETQRRELRESKAVLEERLECPVRTLAYPVGGYQHFTPATMRIAEECGYEGAFSFHTGANQAGATHRYNIHRIASTDHFGPLFACGAYAPRIFSRVQPAPTAYSAAALTASAPIGTVAPV